MATAKKAAKTAAIDLEEIGQQPLKKLGLERNSVPEMIQKPVGAENVLDPRDPLRDPAFIGAVAREVATQLRAGGASGGIR